MPRPLVALLVVLQLVTLAVAGYAALRELEPAEQPAPRPALAVGDPTGVSAWPLLCLDEVEGPCIQGPAEVTPPPQACQERVGGGGVGPAYWERHLVNFAAGSVVLYDCVLFAE